VKVIIFLTRILRWLIYFKKIIREKTATQRRIYVKDRTDFYKQMWGNAAAILGADFKTLSGAFWEINRDSKMVRLHNYMVPLDDPVTLRIAGTKDLCYSMLTEINIPIPDYTVFEVSQIKKGICFFKEKKGPFVVKPSSGTSGARGISLWVRTNFDFMSAVALASLYDKRILIEQMITGESYRLLFLGDRLLHAARRTGVRVIGNGSSSLHQLIEDTMINISTANSAFKDDSDLKFTLTSQNYSLNYVPKNGEQILVKSLPEYQKEEQEIITEYTENITSKLSKSIVNTALKASKQLGVYFAGVDLITTDPTIPLEHSGGAIIDVNSTPGLHHHYNLKNQSERDQPAVLVLKHLLGINE